MNYLAGCKLPQELSASLYNRCGALQYEAGTASSGKQISLGPSKWPLLANEAADNQSNSSLTWEPRAVSVTIMTYLYNALLVFKYFFFPPTSISLPPLKCLCAFSKSLIPASVPWHWELVSQECDSNVSLQGHLLLGFRARYTKLR